MAQVEPGDTIKVHYVGRLADGATFENSHGREPFQFAVGWGEVIPGFDKAVVGMSPGQSKTVTLPPDEAYGLRDESLVGWVERENFSQDLELRAGLMLQVDHPDMPSTIISVLEVEESKVLLDGNHPLAGRVLTFEIELVEIV